MTFFQLVFWCGLFVVGVAAAAAFCDWLYKILGGK